MKQIVCNLKNKSSFISCGIDGCIRIWNFLGERWQCIQIINPIDNLQYTLYLAIHFIYGYTSVNPKIMNMKLAPKDFSFRNKDKNIYKITSISVDWVLNEIYAGDNRGTVSIFDINTGNLKHSLPISGLKVEKISQTRNYIGITLSSGYTVVYDKSNDYKVYLKLENASSEIGIINKFKKGLFSLFLLSYKL